MDNILETCSTIYHTPSGDMEIPDPGVTITEKSNLAPLWLIFPEQIINTKHIIYMKYYKNGVEIHTINNHFFVKVSDADITWHALQKAFAEGVSDVE